MKISFFKSLRFRISAIIAIAVIITGIALVLTYKTNVEKRVSEMAQNNLNDLAGAYGRIIEDELDNHGAETAFEYSELSRWLNGVGLNGIESSYVYIVSREGTMMYHPTQDKVGSPVENSVVKGLVSDIGAGRKIVNSVVSYEYKGTMKYAAYYVDDAQSFILVVTSDEAELFSPIDKINNIGIICMLGICIICVAIAIIYIKKSITMPIQMLAGIVDKTSKMDLTESPEQEKLNSRSDEIGIMSHSIGDLCEALRQIVITIKDGSAAIISCANDLKVNVENTHTTMSQVNSAVGDIASGATNQADETQRASENVSEMGEMILTTNDTVKEILESAKTMSESNRNAGRIIDELRKINETTGEFIETISKQTEVTNESASKIGEATKLITSIASETNLLSLNASIEAARAGDAGRGFAVVASEIQKLAEESNESAKKIDMIIANLLADSEKAVDTMGKVKEIIKSQTEYIRNTEEAFEIVKQGVEDSVRGMGVISEKTQNLDGARSNVIDSVNGLMAIAEENAAASEETSASVESVSSIVADINEKAIELEKVSYELDEKVSVFKL